MTHPGAHHEPVDPDAAPYFDLLVAQIDDGTAGPAGQPLLVRLNLLLLQFRKYQHVAKDRLRSVDLVATRAAFDAWYARCEPQIPVHLREKTRTTADRLFAELDRLAT